MSLFLEIQYVLCCMYCVAFGPCECNSTSRDMEHHEAWEYLLVLFWIRLFWFSTFFPTALIPGLKGQIWGKGCARKRQQLICVCVYFEISKPVVSCGGFLKMGGVNHLIRKSCEAINHPFLGFPIQRNHHGPCSIPIKYVVGRTSGSRTSLARLPGIHTRCDLNMWAKHSQKRP